MAAVMERQNIPVRPTRAALAADIEAAARLKVPGEERHVDAAPVIENGQIENGQAIGQHRTQIKGGRPY